MLKKLRVKRRLLVCFLTVDLVILVMTTIGLTGLKYTLKNQNILTQYIIPINTEVLSARLYSNTIAAKLGEMMLAQDPSAYDYDIAVIDELLTELNTSLTLLDSLYQSDSADRQNIDAYFSLIAEWNQITDATLEKLAQQDYASAQQLLISSTSLRQEMIPIEQLAATMHEISEKAATNAQYAEHAHNAVETVSTQILSSNEQMQKMTQAMEKITTSSQQIGKIIKTIEDIAFQTNILALNAAVEAARAGVAGKGFAVVADEVRNLAGKSAEASQSTSALIANSLQSVENGSVIAQETAASLLTVVEGTKKVATQIEHIAAASEEQALAASQVTQGVIQISDVVQTNSATAEESAAASEELSSQALILKTLVEQFKLL